MENNLVNTDHVNYQLKKAQHNLAHSTDEINHEYWQGYIDALKSLLVKPDSLLG